MKTTFESVDIIWKLLNESLDGEITGGVYKYKRHFNSLKEDVIINSLPIVTEAVSECFLNVNCYVPDIVVYKDGVVTNNVPDSLRLSTIASSVISHLAEKSGDGYYFYTDRQGLIAGENGMEHYINIRVKIIFV